MATVSLTTTPAQIDDGTAASLAVVNTGSVAALISRAGANQANVITLRPGQNQVIYPEGSAITAASASGTGSLSVTTTTKPATSSSTAAAAATSVSPLSSKNPGNPAGVKYRGVTLTPQWNQVVGGAGWVSWANLWTTQFSQTAFTNALNDAVTLGANLVSVYTFPDRVTDGTATRATWLNNQKFFLDEAAKRGLYVYYTLSDSVKTGASTMAAQLAELAELVKLLDGYPNVVGINMGNELNAKTGSLPDFTAWVTALFTMARANTSKPLTCNIEYTGTPPGTADGFTAAVLANNPDFFDFHVYRQSGGVIYATTTDVATIHSYAPGLPVLLGEGCSVTDANAQLSTDTVNAMRSIAELPYVIGVILFPSHDYDDTGTPATQGLINSSNGLERTASTYPFRTIPRRSQYQTQTFTLATGSTDLTTSLASVDGATFPLATALYDAAGPNADPQYRVSAVVGGGLGVGDTVELAVVNAANTATVYASGTALVAGTGSTTTPDSGPSTHTATVSGGSVVASPWSGYTNALSFSGTPGSGVFLPATLGWSSGSQFSLEMKFKRATATNTGLQILASKWFGTSGTAANFILGLSSAGNIFLYQGSTFFQDTAFSVNDTSAHDIAFCWGSQTVYLFLDGTLRGSYALTSGSVGTADSTTQLVIAGAAGPNRASFNGTVEEVRISNTARHTATYTPDTSPLSSDGNTLALLHLDSTDVATTNNLAKVSTSWKYIPSATTYAQVQIRNQAGARGVLYSAAQEVRYA